jgi:hypothetical protein
MMAKSLEGGVLHDLVRLSGNPCFRAVDEMQLVAAVNASSSEWRLSSTLALPRHSARDHVSNLVEVAGDPSVLVTQIALCDTGQMLLAHASAVRWTSSGKPVRR